MLTGREREIAALMVQGYELFANVVYSLQPNAIKDVVVNGEIIVKEGVLQTVSEKTIVEKVNRLFEKWG